MKNSSSIVKKYSGCFLGLAMGDAYGAALEGGPIERFVWKIIGKTKTGKLRYTDDTQMSIDLANSFIKNRGINQDHLAHTFAQSYRYSRGYGPSAAHLLKKIKNGARWQDLNRATFKEGSFGNGAAMRAPILALCFLKDKEALDKSIVKSAEITHAHPKAIEGARLIALVTYAALQDYTNEAILDALPDWCESDEYRSKISFCITSLKAKDTITPKLLKDRLGNGIAAAESCVTAIYFALKYREDNYELMLNTICKLGGDTDTIGAMSGAIWGAFNGEDALNKDKINSIENADEIILLSNTLYKLSSKQ